MRQRVRGSLAVLSGAIPSVGLVRRAMAAPGQGESEAIYEFHESPVDGLRCSKSELQEGRAYRDDPRWYVAEGGWGYIDVDRLAAHVPIAQHVADHPGARTRAEPGSGAGGHDGDPRSRPLRRPVAGDHR